MEWKTVKLGEVANIQTGPFGSQLHNEDYVLKGTPIVTVEHLGARLFSTQNLPCVSDTDKERLKKYSLIEGDIVFSRVGSVDRCSYVTSHEDGWLFSGRCLRVRTNEDIYPMFLYYYLQKEDIKQSIRNIAVGATMPSINTKLLSEIEVSHPSIETQRRIAAILSSLDDKIENNNRINRNLEAQAQALFKSWFVDFEPWGGTMPEDWKEGTLGEIIAEIESGSRPKGGAQTSGIPSIGAEKIERFGIYDFSGEKYVSEEFFHKMRRGHVKDGDVMLYKDGAYTGKCSMALDGFPYKVCAVNEHVFLLRTKEAKYQYYLYLNMIQESVRSMIYTLACSKAAQPGLNTSEVLGVKTIIPAETTIADFNSKIAEMMHTIANNCLESARLAALRDTLLPKLMRGEITL